MLLHYITYLFRALTYLIVWCFVPANNANEYRSTFYYYVSTSIFFKLCVTKLIRIKYYYICLKKIEWPCKHKHIIFSIKVKCIIKLIKPYFFSFKLLLIYFGYYLVISLYLFDFCNV